MREGILADLHAGHQGIEKTRRLARDSVFWPKINDHISKMVSSCKTCQAHHPRQQKEPLEPQGIPMNPWTKLGTDLFMIGKDTYLLIVDYHSKFPVVCKLSGTLIADVARETAAIFGLFGAPAEIVSDNGPQFVGQAYHDMCSRWSVKQTTLSPLSAFKWTGGVNCANSQVDHNQVPPVWPKCGSSASEPESDTHRLPAALTSRNFVWEAHMYHSAKQPSVWCDPEAASD